MPRLPSHVKRYKISHMWEIHHEIVRLAVTGMRPKEIADTLGCTEAMVTYTLNSPLAQAKLEVLRLRRDQQAIDLSERIQEAAAGAFEYLQDVAFGQEKNAAPALRARVCCEILDRAGYSKVQKSIAYNFDKKLTDEDIAAIVERASSSPHSIVVEANAQETGQ